VQIAQRLTRQIGPAPAGHHGPDLYSRIRGRDQGRARAGARAEVADRQRGGVGLACQPTGDIDQPVTRAVPAALAAVRKDAPGW
jgi:hypothetical protein